MTTFSPDDAQVKSACTDLIVGFAYLVDQRRYPELCDLFAEDGIFERPGLRAEGHEAIRAFLDARSLETETRHVCAPPFFEEIGKDHARAITYVSMFHGPPPPEGSPISVTGVAGLVEFHHRFIRTEAGWRIAHHESRVVVVTSQ
jgi:hypothetical protein